MDDCDQKQQQVVQQNLHSVFPPPRRHPWLMLIHGKKGQHQTFYSLSDNCVHIKTIPNIRRKLYFGSYFGWMIFLDEYKHSDDCFLLNPVSMKKIQLPPFGDFRVNCCLLSSPPDDPACIVLFVELKQGPTSFRFCKPGDADWSYRDFEIGEDELLQDAIPCGESIYALISSPGSRKLVNLDIWRGGTIVMEAEALPTIPFLDIERMSSSTWYGLVESCGQVFLVTFVYEGSRPPANQHVCDIVIQKMDICKKEWIKVESIGDQAFFIGGSCWNSCPAKESGIQGNTIYFTMDQDRSLYAFDLEEKSLTLTMPWPDVKNNWSQPDWVVPYL